jgi:cytochrome c biogenesis protein
MRKFILKILADLRFAILLLLLIAAFSIIGTVIEQDQPLQNYVFNYPVESAIFGFIDFKFIFKFGLDHIYKTYWFIFLILIFGVSLLSCTYLQQLPSLRIARRCQFFRNKNQFKKLKITHELKNKLLSNFLFTLNEQNYSIFLQHKIIYAYKGLIGRIAPIIVHLSMICILVGSVYGSIGGFNAQELIPKTETFHIQNILSKGSLSRIPNESARVNDFWITYNKKTTINQFYSNISFLNKKGQELNTQTISVNHPAKYKGITFYQTDWSLIGLRIKDFSTKILQYPLISSSNKSSEKIWISWVPLNNELTEGLTLLVNNLQGYISIYDNFGNLRNNLELNDSLTFEKKITLVDIISSTGLQIKTDPGIPIIYLGFGFLMLSTLISYLTYSQIWLIQDQKNLSFGGNTNRAKFEFELEFKKLMKKNKIK